MPSCQSHRGCAGRAKLVGRRTRASAAAQMHQPTPSTHRNRRRVGFANRGACGWVGRLQEHGM
eukprot:4803312-Pyramimonas_sp.AAC.1